MKCMAARATDSETAGDKNDIMVLVRNLGLRTEDEVMAAVTRFFPVERILPKTQFMIHEIMAELNRN